MEKLNSNTDLKSTDKNLQINANASKNNFIRISRFDLPTNLGIMYDDYDVLGLGDIYRAKVVRTIENGDVFNIYRGFGTKEGCVWIDNLITSLKIHLLCDCE